MTYPTAISISVSHRPHRASLFLRRLRARLVQCWAVRDDRGFSLLGVSAAVGLALVGAWVMVSSLSGLVGLSGEGVALQSLRGATQVADNYYDGHRASVVTLSANSVSTVTSGTLAGFGPGSLGRPVPGTRFVAAAPVGQQIGMDVSPQAVLYAVPLPSPARCLYEVDVESDAPWTLGGVPAPTFGPGDYWLMARGSCARVPVQGRWGVGVPTTMVPGTGAS